MPTVLNTQIGPIRGRNSDVSTAIEGKSPQEGSWSCPQCGGFNFPHREVCYFKSCSGVRPDVSCQDRSNSYFPSSHQSSHHHRPKIFPHTEDSQKMPCWSPIEVQEGKSFFSLDADTFNSGGPSHPYQHRVHNRAPLPVGGNWTCRWCNNINYPDRTVCNRKECGRPRDEGDQTPSHGQSFFEGNFRASPGGGGPSDNWTCPACGNDNYPNRTRCNNRRCGRPRTDNVANLSGEQLGSRTPRNSGPPRAGENGNWRCSVCGNVNYPSRDRCNGKGCGRQREEVEAKAHAPNTRSTRDTGAGNWVCPACSNLNYAHRTRCNRKQCGLPRPLGA